MKKKEPDADDLKFVKGGDRPNGASWGNVKGMMLGNSNGGAAPMPKPSARSGRSHQGHIRGKGK